MAKKKTETAQKLVESNNVLEIQQLTIQEPQPGKFKIVLGEHEGVVWGCVSREDTSIKKTRLDYLKSIKKTSASYLTLEQIDNFLIFVCDAGFRVKMPIFAWKQNFARRFQQYLAKNKITLKELEEKGFSEPSSKRWLRNLHKNGFFQSNVYGLSYEIRLCKLLGVHNLYSLH